MSAVSRDESAGRSAAGARSASAGAASASATGSASRRSSAAESSVSSGASYSRREDLTSGTYAREMMDEAAARETLGHVRADQQASLNRRIEILQAMGMGGKMKKYFGPSGPLDDRVSPFHEDFTRRGRQAIEEAEWLTSLICCF